VLLSLPRDSFLPIPGKREQQSSNAAFAFGGGKLLAETVPERYLACTSTIT